MKNSLGHGFTVWRVSSVLFLLISIEGCSSIPMSTEEPLFQKKYGHFAYCGLEMTKQHKSNSCGSACLVPVLKYWGLDVTEQEILDEFPMSPKGGYSIVQLKDIAKEKGLEGYALAMRLNPLQQLKENISKGRPVICAVRFPSYLYFAYDVPIYGQIYRTLLWWLGPRKNHYIVAFGIKDDEFLIIDPAYGFTTLHRKHLEDCWSKKAYTALLCARKQKAD